jgi:hypothetical protein
MSLIFKIFNINNQTKLCISTSFLCGVLVYESDNLSTFFSFGPMNALWQVSILASNLFVVLNTIFVGALNNFDVLDKSTL